jgi:uncharacterized protein (DUF1810 family)
MHDPYDLQRFVDAQQPVFETVKRELLGGRKQSHWMWFIFPQVKGLGHSDTARKFAISSQEEAEAYLNHSLLGNRLRECSKLVATHRERSTEEFFGYPDTLKFRSSMTLFAHAAQHIQSVQTRSGNEVFDECLRKYFNGEPDPLTLALLAVASASGSCRSTTRD